MSTRKASAAASMLFVLDQWREWIRDEEGPGVSGPDRALITAIDAYRKQRADDLRTLTTEAAAGTGGEPRGCPTPGACSCPAASDAVTAEAIARWIVSEYGCSRFDQGGIMEVVDEIRAGAWRGVKP